MNGVFTPPLCAFCGADKFDSMGAHPWTAVNPGSAYPGRYCYCHDCMWEYGPCSSDLDDEYAARIAGTTPLLGRSNINPNDKIHPAPFCTFCRAKEWGVPGWPNTALASCIGTMSNHAHCDAYRYCYNCALKWGSFPKLDKEYERRLAIANNTAACVPAGQPSHDPWSKDLWKYLVPTPKAKDVFDKMIEECEQSIAAGSNAYIDSELKRRILERLNRPMGIAEWNDHFEGSWHDLEPYGIDAKPFLTKKAEPPPAKRGPTFAEKRRMHAKTFFPVQEKFKIK